MPALAKIEFACTLEPGLIAPRVFFAVPGILDSLMAKPRGGLTIVRILVSRSHNPSNCFFHFFVLFCRAKTQQQQQLRIYGRRKKKGEIKARKRTKPLALFNGPLFAASLWDGYYLSTPSHIIITRLFLRYLKFENWLISFVPYHNIFSNSFCPDRHKSKKTICQCSRFFVTRIIRRRRHVRKGFVA